MGLILYLSAIFTRENTGFTPSRLNTRCVRFSRAATTEGRRRLAFNPIRFHRAIGSYDSSDAIGGRGLTP